MVAVDQVYVGGGVGGALSMKQVVVACLIIFVSTRAVIVLFDMIMSEVFSFDFWFRQWSNRWAVLTGEHNVVLEKQSSVCIWGSISGDVDLCGGGGDVSGSDSNGAADLCGGGGDVSGSGSNGDGIVIGGSTSSNSSERLFVQSGTRSDCACGVPSLKVMCL